ncbi:hypothetical protein JCM19296_1510 [Nonlabens ulvanivorans]|uniref:Uncharacterized protein n=1 Tax=Nonlabens ulvanivorans TaxID=906888 RepID=A0A081DAG7_NONUL|nr:hypothetical protein [Nonlabens ulvanivorans]GAK75913.1 hypothetical protein JCM19296_1510 [Nonlabens ulvanivorans]
MLYKKTVKFLLLFLFVIGPGFVEAHNPSQSGTLLYQINDTDWAVQVSSSLSAFEGEVAFRFGKDSFASPEEFKEQVIQLLSENINISFNGGKNLKLVSPLVILGHETKVVFQILNVPNSINSLTVKNSSFKNVSRNKSLLVVAEKNGAKNKFTLESSNDHTVNLISSDQGLIIVKEEKASSLLNIWTLSIAGLLLIMIIGLIYFKNKKQKNV